MISSYRTSNPNRRRNIVISYQAPKPIRPINGAIKSPTRATTVRLIREYSQATIPQTPRLYYESLLQPRSYPNRSTQYNMSYKPKNE